MKNSNLKISQISQISGMRNKKAKKAPVKGVDETLKITDSKIIFTNPQNISNDKENNKNK